jgi:hypothetical protein
LGFPLQSFASPFGLPIGALSGLGVPLEAPANLATPFCLFGFCPNSSQEAGASNGHLDGPFAPNLQDKSLQNFGVLLFALDRRRQCGRLAPKGQDRRSKSAPLCTLCSTYSTSVSLILASKQCETLVTGRLRAHRATGTRTNLTLRGNP